MMGLEMALGTALRHWKLIGWGLTLLVLGSALLLTRATLADAKTDLTKEKAAHAETIANYRLAQEAATVKAERQLREVESLYRRNADEAENLHAAELADANDAAERYIASHRVRTQGAQCAPGGTAAPASSDRPGVPAAASAAPELVAVTGADIRACTAAVIYGDNAYRWARTLIEKP